MNDLKRMALEIGSLSIYKGILTRAVPGALYRLLLAADRSEREFAEAWGAFFSVLCERGRSENLAGCFTETALYDENAFSLSAAAGKTDFPRNMADAVERDIRIIQKAASITPEDVLSGCGFASETEPLGLPRWETGEPVGELKGNSGECVRKIEAYYRANGCGIYTRYRAFIWRNSRICPVAYPDSTMLADLKGYEVQRSLAIDNTAAFLDGLPANNCLLYGDRGTGKSSTVKALLNQFYTKGLRMIEMPKESLSDFPLLVDEIAPLPMKFIIFIDDLSFSVQNETYASLKAVLEGGLAARPENTLIYATSNRRHLVRESFSDREGDEIHLGDTIQESLSLADRFGLSINFSLPDRDGYLEIVRKLAAQRGIEDHGKELEEGAEQWAIVRGGRSPRCAKQYVRFAEARIRRGLPLA